jgi:hypothetical protein
MTKKFSLVGKRTLDRNVRYQYQRDKFLENLLAELAARNFTMKATPARERIKVNETPDGSIYAEYKSSVTIDVFGGPGLPMEFEMTEVVFPSKLSDED